MAVAVNGDVAIKTEPLNLDFPPLRTWQRYVILFVVSWNCFVVSSTSTSVLIATPEIAEALDTTPQILNATNSAVLIAMGCSSLLWLPLADIFSRRNSYIAALVLMFLTSIGSAVAPNVATFTSMRILTGLTGTYFMVAGQTIIADIFVPVVRGKAVGCMMVGSVAGSAIGPCIGGIILTYNNWRSMYWLQVGQAGLGLFLTTIFIPHIKSEVSGQTQATKLSVRGTLVKFNPRKVLKQLLCLQVFLADLACGFLALLQYALLTSVRHIINPRFNLSTPLFSGLFYLAPGLGFVVGSLIGGHLSDRTVKHWIARRNGLRLPKDRLNSSVVHFWAVLPISVLLYSWGLRYDFGGPALASTMAFVIGLGLMGAWNGLNTYTAEVIPSQRSEVVCSKYIVQYAFGAAATGIVTPLIDHLGAGWAFTIFLFINLGGGAVVMYIARFAPDVSAS